MKKTMVFFLSLTFLFSLNKAKATHLIGADMQWKCLGNDTFEIKLVLYRRCTDGAIALSIYPPTVTSDSCSNAYTVTVGSLIEHLVDEITPICNSQQKLCPSSGGSGVSTSQIPFGVEKHTLRYKLYLGGAYSNCCWYKLQWEQQARNSNITTGYADKDFLLESWLNRCISPCDNGPEFKNPPITIEYAGQNVIYNNGVYDADNDSLSYDMALPLGGNYTSPWSYKYPVTCLGGNNPNMNASPPTGFNLDSITGDIFFRPMQVQISVFKVMVNEWRKDSIGLYHIIGKTGRDMQIAIVQNGNNRLPGFSGPFPYEACAGQQTCFTINTLDQDLGDTTRILWNNGIPAGALWSTNNGVVKNATGTLCWTPVDSNVSTLPYYLTITVADNHCPIMGSVTKAYSIKVKPTPKSIRILTKISCSLYQFKMVPQSNNFPGATYNWYLPKLLGTGIPSTVYSSIDSVQYQFTQSGSYLLKSTMSFDGCTNTYLDTLVVDSNRAMNIAAISNTVLCPGDTAVLIADSSSSYQWYNDSMAIPGAISRIYRATKAGKYSIRYPKNNCFFTSNTITISEVLKLTVTKPIPICSGDNVIYRASGLAGATYLWYQDGVQIPGANSDIYIATQDGYYYCIVSQPKCTVQTNTDTVIFLSLPAKPLIIQNNITLISSPAFTYQWYFNNVHINGATDSFYIATISGSYKVKISDAIGCFNYSDPYNFNVGIKPNFFASKINISPNPFHNKLSIEIKDFDKPVFISLYDMEGKLILKQNITARGIASMNTSSLSNGIYLLEVSDGENKAKYKVEKQ